MGLLPKTGVLGAKVELFAKNEQQFPFCWLGIIVIYIEITGALECQETRAESNSLLPEAWWVLCSQDESHPSLRPSLPPSPFLHPSLSLSLSLPPNLSSPKFPTSCGHSLPATGPVFESGGGIPAFYNLPKAKMIGSADGQSWPQ